MIRLPAEIADSIAEQSQSEMPNEACGYLAGVKEGPGVTVRKRYAMTNVDASPDHFSFDPKEQFAAVKDARSSGLAMVANYHSHPETPSRVSEEDKRLAIDTSILYLIHSVADDTLKAFAVDGERTVTEVELIVE